MKEIIDLLKMVVIMTTVFGITFIILLSQKESRLRGITLKAFAWFLYSATGLLALYIISPVDIIPDIIPVIGQMDDGAAVISAIFTGLSGFVAMRQGNNTMQHLTDRTESSTGSVEFEWKPEDTEHDI